MDINSADNKTKFDEEGGKGGAIIQTNKFDLTWWFKK